MCLFSAYACPDYGLPVRDDSLPVGHLAAVLVCMAALEDIPLQEEYQDRVDNLCGAAAFGSDYIFCADFIITET